MKNINRKTLIIISVVILMVVGLFCRHPKADKVSDEAMFSDYITAYTSGIVSKTSAIKIRLTDQMVEKIKPAQNKVKDVFGFNPSIDGDAKWADNNTIEFVPKKHLDSDKEYNVEFYLNKLAEVPRELRTFNFSFQTIRQNIDLTIRQVVAQTSNDLKQQKIIGSIRTADYIETSQLQKVLSVSGANKHLKISWRSGVDGTEHHFEVDSIPRLDNKYNVVIKLEGSELNVPKTDVKEIEIPAYGHFAFTSSRIVHQPEQYLELQFSDPLKENQNLSGLINIKNTYNEKFVIEGNLIKVYPKSRLAGKYTVGIYPGIKNIEGFSLKKELETTILFEELKPAVRLACKGTILPSGDKGLIFPFEAVNLKAVDVTIIRIYESQVTQFLQVNNMSGSYQLRRVAKPVLFKTVDLSKSDIVDFGQWNRFTLDLNEMLKAEPGAIYRVTIGFRNQHSLYNCGEKESKDELTKIDEPTEIEDDQDVSGWDGIEDYYNDYYYYGSGYWENRDNPCHKAYYGKRRAVHQNIMSTNIGLIAKRGNDGSVTVVVNNILTTEPMSGVNVKLISYQNQTIDTKTTSAEGIVEFKKAKDAYFAVAEQGKQKGYLKMNDGGSLSLSHFDVSGVAVKKGIKGFIYGERGVWRPGDSVFVTFILQEDAEPLPDNHPIVFELKNPEYQIVKREVKKKNKLGFYSFNFKTKDEAPTGNWGLTVNVGGSSFYKKLKIETVKPNRLKIKFDFDKDYLVRNEQLNANMNVKWLHGANAGDLKARVEMVLNAVSTRFDKYKDYVFDDPTKKFYSEYNTFFKGKLDNQGNTTITGKMKGQKSAPGKLKATFITKVFEKSGDFSVDQFSVPYYPYESFVGLKLPKGDKARGMLMTDTTHNVEMVIVDAEGNRIKEKHLIEMEFYKLSWRWWWDKSANDLSSYSYNRYNQKIKKENIYSKNGIAKWNLKINYPDWGRYLVRAHDLSSGHSTAKIIYIDWPGWAGRQRKDFGGGASVLTFNTDKTKYTAGEKIKLNIPTSQGGRALVSVENGTKVIDNFWVETKDGETEFSFFSTLDMTPNVYINVTLLQPHSQTQNDLPIRLYGVVPVTVENQGTHLTPELDMPDELESESEIEISVSEKDDKEMTYTLAIVDEGLLDLTRFKTPKPWNSFYAKEALGVKSWDVYDDVIGAFGDKIESLLAIGGDAELEGKESKKAKRFKPMVKFLGPFHLSGGKHTHKIKLPKYIGSVRTMVVAGHNKCYGSTEKTTPVTKPLMLLGTLPRVLGPGEKVKLPVTIFAMDDKIDDVKIEIVPNELFTVEGDKEKNVAFEKTGEKMVEFDLIVKENIGIGKVKIKAKAGRFTADYEIELDVRNPNPMVTNVVSEVVQGGKSWQTDYIPVGIEGTNKAFIEVSSVPPMNLEKRLKFLIRYPHGCIEQTTSSVFPQLYLADLLELDYDKKKMIDENIKAGIDRISNFQIFNGGFGYWPGSSNVSEWGTNYAGHFLLEAKRKGYSVAYDVLRKWIKYQKQKASSWIDDGSHSQFTQAYRLYTLALADKAEKGAMNRLKEKSKLTTSTKWRLAAAYVIAGKKKIAEKMVENLTTTIPEYNELDYTFGSNIRDIAMILETLTLLDDNKQAFLILKQIAEKMASKRWYSTQTTAYSLIAIAGYLKKNAGADGLKYSYKPVSGEEVDITSKKSIAVNEISVGVESGSISVNNNGSGALYVRLVTEGKPAVGDQTDAAEGVKIDVKYKLMDGTLISPEKVSQGTDFMAEVSIKNTSTSIHYRQMALNQIFPSGWEILNPRMLNYGSVAKASTPNYQDFRDDRVYTYFHLNKGQTKTFKVLLNASYAGKYYLPSVSTEAMYDATINARKHGMWVEVVQQ